MTASEVSRSYRTTGERKKSPLRTTSSLGTVNVVKDMTVTVIRSFRAPSDTAEASSPSGWTAANRGSLPARGECNVVQLDARSDVVRRRYGQAFTYPGNNRVQKDVDKRRATSVMARLTQERNEGNGCCSIPPVGLCSVATAGTRYNAPSTNWRTTFRSESSLSLSMAGQTGYGHRGRFADGAAATRHGPDSSTRTPPGSLPHPVTTQHARCSTFVLRSR